MIGFIDLLYTPLRTTSNYSDTFNLNNSQITISSDKPFLACWVFTSHTLATGSSSGDSSASALGSLPAVHRLQTQVTSTIFFVLFVIPWHGPYRKHSSSIVTHIRCRGNAFTQLFHSEGSTRDISFRDSFSIVACGHHLAMAVFLVPGLLLSANMAEYYFLSVFEHVIPSFLQQLLH
jgi:hypothetical protein